MAPYFVWQARRPEPVYRHEVMRQFYYQEELGEFERIHRPSGFLPRTLFKAIGGVLFYGGIALLPPLIMLRRTIMDRRIRFLIVGVVVMMAGMVVQIFLVPHYLAPFTSAFYAIGLQSMRHLRLWTPEGRPVGAGIVRLIVLSCVLLAALRTAAEPLHLRLAEWPVSQWICSWYGPGTFGVERVQIASTLERLPGKQLVLVRYSSNHNPFDEWVYNSADIDGSKIVWAREMNAANDLELIHYYRDRRVWLVQPDLQPARLSPYTAARENAPLR